MATTVSRSQARPAAKLSKTAGPVQVNIYEAKTHLSALVERAAMLHSDPFDRLLIAQSQIEGFHLATIDTAMRKYAVDLL